MCAFPLTFKCYIEHPCGRCEPNSIGQLYVKQHPLPRHFPTPHCDSALTDGLSSSSSLGVVRFYTLCIALKNSLKLGRVFFKSPSFVYLSGSSGKSFLTSTESNLMAPTTASLNCNWNASMSTIMKQAEASMFPVPFLWIWSLALWIPFVLDHLASFSALTISSLAKAEPVTTGPRVTTLKELNWSTLFLTLSAKKLKAAIAFR